LVVKTLIKNETYINYINIFNIIYELINKEKEKYI